MTQDMRWPPSKGGRSSACPGSVALISSGYNDRMRNKKSNIGTYLHSLASRVINGEKINEEDSVIREYVSVIIEEANNNNSEIFIERRVEVKRAPIKTVGKVDAVIKNGKMAKIIDFKSGIDEVKPDCDQMMIYAGALCEEFPEITILELIIIQPKSSDSIKKKIVSSRDVSLYINDTLIPSQEKSIRSYRDIHSIDSSWSDIYLKSGNHCFFCPVKSSCPLKTTSHIKRGVDDVIDIISQISNRDISDMSDEDLSVIYASSQIMADFVGKINDEAKKRYEN